LEYVYMDNFRGFSKTLIPLRKTSFLVGENSTGKSSFLSLVSLLYNSAFWYSQDFSVFGGFSDIVSAASKDKSSFCVGCIKDTLRSTHVDRNLSCYAFFFKKDEALPGLKQYIEYCNKTILVIKIYKTYALYKFIYHTLEPDLLNDYSRLIPSFEEIINSSDAPFLRYNYRSMEMPLLLIRTLILGTMSDSSDSSESSSTPTFPTFLQINNIAPIRTKPQKIYEGSKKKYSPEGEHIPFILRQFLNSKDKSLYFRDLILKFGDSSGLFSGIDVHSFGKDLSSPFEVILNLSGNKLNLSNVGYGVSQILPIVVEMLTKEKGQWFSIQQPEVHLHPRAQTAFGDLVYRLSTNSNHRFIIETHSDYIIDQFRLNIKKNGNTNEAQVLFFERINNKNVVYTLPFDRNGKYPIDQPRSFRDFFIKQEIEYLGL